MRRLCCRMTNRWNFQIRVTCQYETLCWHLSVSEPSYSDTHTTWTSAMNELNQNVNTPLFFFQTKCFICGIGNDYFDRTPHGFETHTLQEHNLANYLWVQQQMENNVSSGSDCQRWHRYLLLCAGFSWCTWSTRTRLNTRVRYVSSLPQPMFYPHFTSLQHFLLRCCFLSDPSQDNRARLQKLQ